MKRALIHILRYGGLYICGFTFYWAVFWAFPRVMASGFGHSFWGWVGGTHALSVLAVWAFLGIRLQDMAWAREMQEEEEASKIPTSSFTNADLEKAWHTLKGGDENP